MLNYKDLIAEDPETHSAFFVHYIRKQQDYSLSCYLVTMSTGQFTFPSGTYTIISGGNIVTALYYLVSWLFQRVSSFLSFNSSFYWTASSWPWTSKDADFRKFHCQLLHSALEKILEALKPFMMEADVVCCPDGHFLEDCLWTWPIYSWLPWASTFFLVLFKAGAQVGKDFVMLMRILIYLFKMYSTIWWPWQSSTALRHSCAIWNAAAWHLN